MLFNFNKKDPVKELEALKKSYEILNERYQKKVITIEEFSSKCNEINKKIEKYQKMISKNN